MDMTWKWFVVLLHVLTSELDGQIITTTTLGRLVDFSLKNHERTWKRLEKMLILVDIHIWYAIIRRSGLRKVYRA